MQEEIEDIKAKVHEIRLMESEIVIHHNLTDILHGLENYSHLLVLYWAHKVPEQSRSLTRVHPMGRKEIPATGIFPPAARHGPIRCSPVLYACAKLTRTF